MEFAQPGADVQLLLQQARSSRNAAAAGSPERQPAGASGKAAQEFEAMFLAQMLRPIFEGIETDAMFGGGPGEKAYKGLLVEEYGKAIARAGGVGIADAVQAEILKLQESGQ